MSKILLCADLHIRIDQPISRTDDYFKAQFEKLEFINQTFVDHNCIYAICAGDFFHKAKSHKLLEWKLMSMASPFINSTYTIPGNHDLPYHNLEKLNESSLGLLDAANNIEVFPTPLGTMFKLDLIDRIIGIIHSLIHKDNPIKIKDQTISKDAKKILKENPDCDLILSGDNHETFVEEYEGRLLVNPGSMMRMTAAQTEHKPCVFLYDLKEHSLEQVFIPIKKNVIDRSHIDKEQQKQDRFNTLINRMSENVELSLSFESNMKNFIAKNKISEAVKKIIWGSVDG